MKAKITRINPPRISRNGDVAFHRLHLQLEDGSHAMTDLVSSFRNFANWKPVIKAGVGTWIMNVELIKPGKVNADSQVMIIQAPLLQAEPIEMNWDEIKAFSRTDPSKEYKIVRTMFGWECSCEGFRYRKTCKHIEELKTN